MKLRRPALSLLLAAFAGLASAGEFVSPQGGGWAAAQQGDKATLSGLARSAAAASAVVRAVPQQARESARMPAVEVARTARPRAWTGELGAVDVNRYPPSQDVMEAWGPSRTTDERPRIRTSSDVVTLQPVPAAISSQRYVPAATRRVSGPPEPVRTALESARPVASQSTVDPALLGVTSSERVAVDSLVTNSRVSGVQRVELKRQADAFLAWYAVLRSDYRPSSLGWAWLFTKWVLAEAPPEAGLFDLWDTLLAAEVQARQELRLSGELPRAQRLHGAAAHAAKQSILTRELGELRGSTLPDEKLPNRRAVRLP